MLTLNCLRSLHCMCKIQLHSKDISSAIIKTKSLLNSPVPHSYNFLRNVTTNQLTKKDDVAESDKQSLVEVYKGSVSNYVFKVKSLSLLTSVFAIGVQPLFIHKIVESNTSTAVIIGSYLFLGFFTFVTPVLLHLVTKRYVITIQYCPKTDSYMANTFSFFLQKKTVKFTVDEVDIPDMPQMLTTFKAKGNSYLIDKESFLDISHYMKIMGYDKPFEIRLDEKSDEDK